MADRLQELLQQRALIKEHLAWLEGEIAAASGTSPEARELSAKISPETPKSEAIASARAVVSSPIAATIPTRLPRPAQPAAASAADDEADAMIARLAADEKKSPAPTKTGCWLFFSIVLISLGAAAWFTLSYFYRG